MTYLEQKFIEFFKNAGYTHENGISVIPPDDTGLFFTNSGMVKYKDHFEGKEQPQFTKAVTSQHCIRLSGKHNDLEEVGFTDRHCTNFKMLGHFIFGSHHELEGVNRKQLLRKAIDDAMKFLESIGLDIDKLFVTVHRNDAKTANIWTEHVYIGNISLDDSNFWSAGETGLCGYCTEIYYEGVEIWNIVCIDSIKTENGTESLPYCFIDTGMGLERLTAIIEGKKSIFDTSIFATGKAKVAEAYKLTDEERVKFDTNINVIVDHVVTATAIIEAGVQPSNTGRGHALRKLLRRMTDYSLDMIRAKNPKKTFNNVIAVEGGCSGKVVRTILEEEQAYLRVLQMGKSQFKRLVKDGKTAAEIKHILLDTYGLPVRRTDVMLKELI